MRTQFRMSPHVATRRARRIIGSIAALTLPLVMGAVPASGTSPYTYTGAATVVSQVNGTTVVDNGAVGCTLAADAGAGGFCIPFSDIASSGSTLTVNDSTAGANVSYQVCLDNNGNGTCGDANPGGGCADQIWFSHASTGYANPMSGLPSAHSSGCPGSRGFDGLVVFMCKGVHDTHTETATAGTGSLSSGAGSAGFTEPGPPTPFCGGPTVPPKKAYVVTPNGAFAAFGTFTGTASVAPGLGIPSTTTVNGSWSLSAFVTGVPSGSLNVSGSLGPVAGLGAGCGLSHGHSGSGIYAIYTLSQVGWEASAGGTLPVTGRWGVGTSVGDFSAIVQAQGGAACLSGSATAFNVVGVFGLL